jgi:hypothetical protein
MELRPNDLPSSNSIASRKHKLGTIRQPRKMLTQSDPNQRTRLRLLSRDSANDKSRGASYLQARLEGIVSKSDTSVVIGPIEHAQGPYERNIYLNATT